MKREIVRLEAVAEQVVQESSPWFTSDERYFVYQPSGGISNQRKILEWAVIVARSLNRTLVIPPIAPHTTLYKNFNKQVYTDQSPANDVIDLPLLNKFIKAQPIIGTTFADFILQNEDDSWETLARNNLKEKRAHPWSASTVIEKYDKSPANVLFFKEGTMWQSFDFTRNNVQKAQFYVRFHPKLRSVARELSGYINGGVYNALHIRFADGDASKLREGWLKPARTFMFRMQLAKFVEKSPFLYIATVPKRRNSSYFSRIKLKYKTVFASDLRGDLIDEALKVYPDKLKSSILGVIEQLICARSVKFLGTGFSTFSEYIRDVREQRVIGNDPFVVGDEGEERYLSMNSSCMSEVKVC